MIYPKGKPVIITTLVDADNAHDFATRRSVSALLIFLKKTQSGGTSSGRIPWKPQPTYQSCWTRESPKN